MASLASHIQWHLKERERKNTKKQIHFNFKGGWFRIQLEETLQVTGRLMNPWRCENAASNSHNHEHQLVVCECDCDSESVYWGGGGGALSLDRLGGSSQYSYLSRGVVWWDSSDYGTTPNAPSTHAQLEKQRRTFSGTSVHRSMQMRTNNYVTAAHIHTRTLSLTHTCTLAHMHANTRRRFPFRFLKHDRHKDTLILI